MKSFVAGTLFKSGSVQISKRLVKIRSDQSRTQTLLLLLHRDGQQPAIPTWSVPVLVISTRDVSAVGGRCRSW